mgnify:CR=1 FL=1
MNGDGDGEKARRTALRAPKLKLPAFRLSRPRWRPALRSLRLPELTWRDWLHILRGVRQELARDNVSLIAAGVAFYAMLALFPAIAAFVGLYGMVADPLEVTRNLDAIADLLPESAFEIVAAQVRDLAGAGRTKLGFASILAILIAIWGVRAGVNAIVRGLNVVYGAEAPRKFLAQILVTLTLTGVLFLVVGVAFLAILAIPIILNMLDFWAIGEWAAAIFRWPIVIAAVGAGLAVIYRYGPQREDGSTLWLSWGVALATVLWLVGSAAFSLYVANFASYNETYGSLGAVVGLLMWFYLSAYIILLGAEINAETEKYLRARNPPPPKPGRPDLSVL